MDCRSNCGPVHGGCIRLPPLPTELSLIGKRRTLDQKIGREQAGKYLRKMRDEMARNPFAYGHLLLAVDTWLDGAADVVLVGSGEEVKPFLAVLNSVFAPTGAVSHRDPAMPAPEILEEAFRGRDPSTPVHPWIISSALPSSDGGIVSPNAFAVFSRVEDWRKTP